MKTAKLVWKEVYPVTLMFIHGCSNKELGEFVEKKYDRPLREEPFQDACFFSVEHIESGSKQYYLWLEEEFDWSIDHQQIVAHELLHFTFEYFRDIGLDPSAETEEAYAYFLGSAIKKLWGRLRPKGESK